MSAGERWLSMISDLRNGNGAVFLTQDGAPVIRDHARKAEMVCHFPKLQTNLGSAGIYVFEETCGRALALEHNGDVFTCDHFVYPDQKLGNQVRARQPVKSVMDWWRQSAR